MKTRYILATIEKADDIDSEKAWQPINNSNILNLNDDGIIWSIQGIDRAVCDVICDVNTHEKVFKLE